MFLTTATAFFLVEIGDKTEIATAALAALRIAAALVYAGFGFWGLAQAAGLLPS